MTNEQIPLIDETLLMSQLKDILLREDRSTLQEVQGILNDRTLLEQKINPILEEHLTYLRQNFPKEYAKIVNKMVEQKLQDSQQEILNLIYPVMGKMINKYINFQFQELKDSISTQMAMLTSVEGLKWWFRNRILGLKSENMLLASIDVPVIEEIFLIRRNSGLLLGSAALSSNDNRDVVAGMLTAIKSFVEEAFERKNEDLETIQYGTYKILLENFPSFYFAIAISGSMSSAEIGQLREELIDFIQHTTDLDRADMDSDIQAIISQNLDNKFILPQKIRLQRLKIKSNTGS